MESQYTDRLNNFRREMIARGGSAFLVSNPVNVSWLSGFAGDSSWLLVTAEEQTFLTDSRYTEQAKEECPDWQIVENNTGLIPALKEYLEHTALKGLAVDRAYMTVETFERLSLAAGAKVLLVNEKDPCYELRQIKDRWEILQMERAASIADEALTLLRPAIKPGISERDLALELYNHMSRMGSDGAAFDTIIAAGPQGAKPHARPSDYRLRKGDLVTIDFGAVVNGYRSDMTRTFVLGQADALQTERYNLVLAAQEKAMAGIKPGVAVRDVDSLARDLISGAGYAENFGHGLGHSVGLEIHEDPRFSRTAENVLLKPGMIMTVEPGVYFPGWGGIRIENSVVVTEDSMKSLSGYPKTLEEMTIIC